MRIAFVSCACISVFPNQPVWDWIAAAVPDHLVLLGDSMYLDIDSNPHPDAMNENDFAQHLHNRYSQVIAQPQFASLVRSLAAGHVHAIWDDHDFLWNDADGGAVKKQPTQRDKLPLTTQFMEAFRRTLTAQLAPGTFPGSYTDSQFWQPAPDGLSTPSVALASDVWLHLADVRTWRTGTGPFSGKTQTILGATQRATFSGRYAAAPQALHLFASGSTMAGWERYESDVDWLYGLAANSRTLVLSGDIHRNKVDAFHTGGWPLHEATSSGAAVRTAVVIGKRQHNHGLIDIDADTMEARFFAQNQETMALRRRYSRATWLPV